MKKELEAQILCVKKMPAGVCVGVIIHLALLESLSLKKQYAKCLNTYYSCLQYSAALLKYFRKKWVDLENS